MTAGRFDPEADEMHVLNLCGTLFYIDATSRAEIEHLLKTAERPWDFIVVDTLDGSTLTVLVDAVNSLYSSTPATRAEDRRITQALSPEEFS